MYFKTIFVRSDTADSKQRRDLNPTHNGF